MWTQRITGPTVTSRQGRHNVGPDAVLEPCDRSRCEAAKGRGVGRPGPAGRFFLFPLSNHSKHLACKISTDMIPVVPVGSESLILRLQQETHRGPGEALSGSGEHSAANRSGGDDHKSVEFHPGKSGQVGRKRVSDHSSSLSVIGRGIDSARLRRRISLETSLALGRNLFWRDSPERFFGTCSQ